MARRVPRVEPMGRILPLEQVAQALAQEGPTAGHWEGQELAEMVIKAKLVTLHS